MLNYHGNLKMFVNKKAADDYDDFMKDQDQQISEESGSDKSPAGANFDRKRSKR